MPASAPDPADATRTQVQSVPPVDPAGGTLTAPPWAGAADPDRPAGPDPVPGYVLGEHIGKGGMGVVYAAREVALDREVAIKFLRPDGPPSPVAGQRFETEARVTAGLAHPGIPPVYAFGRLADGRPYLVMKRVRGSTLHDLLQARADPADDIPRFLQIFEQVCQAVGYAHDHRVVHRDVKPRNVMVGAFGEVQVMDWGIAKQLPPPDSATPAGDGVTLAGHPIGTPAYMPPEQAKGEQVDARADVFALGAVLCTILTGEPPYAWTTTSHLPGPPDANLAAAADRLRTCGRDPELVRIAVDCLSADPAGRPPNAAAVARRVEEFRRGVAARLRSAEVERAVAAAEAKAELARARAEAEAEVAAVKERAKEARRRWRRKVRIAAGVAVVLATVTVGAAVWWQADRTASARAAAEAGRRAYADRKRADALASYEAALASYEALRGGNLFWNRATLELELARVYTATGKLREEARNPAEAAAALRHAEELLDHLRDAGGRPEYDLALAEVHHQWGIHFGNKPGHTKAALKHYDKGLSLRENVPAARKADPEYRRGLALGHGYLGDARLADGDFAGAEASYWEALKIRQELADADRGNPDAQCLHARDFGNLGGLFALKGDVPRAVGKHRARLAFYADRLPPLPALLPGEYRGERAGTRCEIAELELDRPDVDRAADTADLLAAARAEYDALQDGSDVRAGKARVLVLRARLAHLTAGSAGRAAAAREAAAVLTELADAGQVRPADEYNRAVAHALLGADDPASADRVLALDRLETAVRKGFADGRRLDRDRVLEAVLGGDPRLGKRFEELRRKLPRPTAPPG